MANSPYYGSFSAFFQGMDQDCLLEFGLGFDFQDHGAFYVILINLSAG